MKKLYMLKLGLMVMLSVIFSSMSMETLAADNITVQNTTVTIEGNAHYNNVTIKNNGTLTINGDLVVDGDLLIDNGGELIVYGSLTSYGDNITSNGKIIIAGDFTTSSQTNEIKNNGDLVVGGNVSIPENSLDLSGNGDLRIFVINPDADVSGIPTGDFGGYEEIGTAIPDDLKDIVDNVIVPAVIGDQWVGNNGNSNWMGEANWTGNKVPTATSNVRIKVSNDNPDILAIDGLIEVNNLTIEAGAVLTIKPGAKLTVNGILTIKEEGGLVMENTTEVNGLASLITHGGVVGKARINLDFPRDDWYYVSQPIKEATSDIYALLDENGSFNTSEAWVNIHRANRWYRIAEGVAIAELEGLSIKYRIADINDEANHLVSYTGELNNGPISRNFSNNQYYLFGNPYPSAINWQELTGWSRNNIGGTIYYRARVNGAMAFVTYNRLADVNARAAVYPDGVTFGDEAELANIPPLQSVWINSFGEGSITIDNEARRHVAAGSLLKSSSVGGNSSVIRIAASSESGGDGSVLYFSENSDEGFDQGDSEKMFNESVHIPEVYTRMGDKAMAINGLPLIQESSRVIPISVRNRVEGEVSLSFDMSAYDGAHAPYLEDRETGAFINLLHENNYNYTVRETGENHDRFVLHFYFVTTDLESPREEEKDAGNAIKIRSLSDKVLVNISSELLQSGDAMVEIYTIDGRKIGAVPARSSRTLLFLPNERGVYIIRAIAGSVVKSERVANSGN